MKVLGSFICAKRDNKKVTDSGIHVVDSGLPSSNIAVVQDVGPNVKSVKKGDTILMSQDYFEQEVNPDEFVAFVEEREVLAIL